MCCQMKQFYQDVMGISGFIYSGQAMGKADILLLLKAAECRRDFDIYLFNDFRNFPELIRSAHIKQFKEYSLGSSNLGAVVSHSVKRSLIIEFIS